MQIDNLWPLNSFAEMGVVLSKKPTEWIDNLWLLNPFAESSFNAQHADPPHRRNEHPKGCDLISPQLKHKPVCSDTVRDAGDEQMPVQQW